MASLMEELLSTMDSEREQYQRLIDLTDQKKDSIIYKKIDVLDGISAIEQEIGDILKALEIKRTALMRDIAIVMGRDGEQITISWMIDNLSNQPNEQALLKEAKESLTKTATEAQLLNQQNQVLLKQALEMVQFDLTLVKSARQAPQTANYGKNAVTTGDLLGRSGFDAKQ